MSTENIIPQDPNPNPPGPTSIKEAVAERLSGSGSTVRENVITILTEEEISKRTKTVMKAINEIDQTRKEVEKANKPDNITFNGDGSIATQSFSKAALDNRNKAQQKLDKLQGALDKALNDSNFTELNKLVGGDKGDKPAE